MNSATTPASQVIERHLEEFTDSKVLFAGDLQDDFPAYLTAKAVKVHTTQFHYYQGLHKKLGENIRFGLLPVADLFNDTDTLIYYWPKSKAEAQFQLSALLNQLSKGSRVFIVGENRSGVRSVETMLADFGRIQKVDTARRCSLYHFEAESRLAFDLKEWWQTYQIDDVTIKSLPGVFSAQHLDVGSELLLSALQEKPEIIRGQILDLGCGAGVLASVIGTARQDVTLTLTDVSAAALAASEATLKANGLTGSIIASDVFSHVEGKFDLIISNPPFHDGRETNYTAVESLIRDAKKHLTINGKICLVANSFLPYPDLLDRAFGRHQVLVQTNKFKVYLA